ncbi:MAG: hypothetical protein WCT85_05895, partial [Parachlamydiales bacterium]
MKTKIRASKLRSLGSLLPKNAELKKLWPWINDRNLITTSRCLRVKIAAPTPIIELINPIKNPQKPKIAAMLLELAPIDLNTAISFFLSLTRSTSIEIIFEH